jgi:pimeloyl-ACP methyl ester carboxylesterase
LIAIDAGIIPAEREPMRAVCERITAPVLVIHGDDDRQAPHAAGAVLAEITGGGLVTVAGGGHGVLARDPVMVNFLLKQFVDRIGR